MPGYKKNKNKGFTLMEVVAAFVILMLICGLTIGSVAVIQQTRLRHCAETVKLKCESARELAKTHGVNVQLDIAKIEDGFKLTISGDNLLTEETTLECGRTELFYQKAGEGSPRQLGVVDSSDVSGTLIDTLIIVFAGGSGDIISRPVFDYIMLANGSKNSKLLFQQSGGMIYYDYESDLWTPNDAINTTKVLVELPRFTQSTDDDGRAVLIANGKTIQPEFAYDARYVKISGVYREKSPSVLPYVIIFELKDPYSTTWADGTTSSVELEWFITES